MLGLINDTGILVVVLALILLFGASAIPKLARNLGEAGREFRKAHSDAFDSSSGLTAAPQSLPSGGIQPASRADYSATIPDSPTLAADPTRTDAA